MKQLPIAILILFYSFCIASQTAHGGELSLTETDDTIRITLRGKPVLEYIKTARPVPKGLEKHFRRSGYIHPVYSPTGEEITGDYPLDHAHQHALFFAWTKSTFDGKKIDFWNQAKHHLRKFNGIDRDSFHWFLKECEWHFNGGNHQSLYKHFKQWHLKKRQS